MTLSGTAWPSVTSGAVGSIPSLMRSGLPVSCAALQLSPKILLGKHPLAAAAENSDLLVNAGGHVRRDCMSHWAGHQFVAP